MVNTTKLPAAVAKKLRKAAESLETDPSIASAQAVLVMVKKLPYDAGDERSYAEWMALEALVELDVDVARRVWEMLVTSWSAKRFVGGTGWHVLARAQATLDATVPPTVRARIREAWAWGVLSNVFEYTAGKSAAKPPSEGSPAWRQGCIEITLQQFDRARACIEALRAVKGYEYSAKCLDIMLHRERGDAAAARASYLELVALARKRKAYAQWDVIAAMFIILGIDDAKLAREIVASWQKKKRAESAIFES